MKTPLTDSDWRWAADSLGVSVAKIKTIAHVESGREGAFYDDGPHADEPVILFEPHHFHKHTKGRFAQSMSPVLAGKRWPLSYRSWIRPNKRAGVDPYGPSSIQHEKLAAAAALDREAALKSCSWGRFQIMGSNYQACGFASLQGFINAMYTSERTQLEAFVGFIRSNGALLAALRAGDWDTVARHYNGPANVPVYGRLLRMAYRKFSSQ